MASVLGIMGSPRTGKATDTLMGRAMEGVQAAATGCDTEVIRLAERDIRPCRNCLTCRDSPDPGPMARCVIRDDMDDICPRILRADGLILGTPVHMGHATSLMMAFLERICWVFARPARRVLTVEGIPGPRDLRPRKAAVIVVSGVVPPLLRWFCDQATPLIRCTVRDSLNARTTGTLYAGAVENRGLGPYLEPAFRLGLGLARSLEPDPARPPVPPPATGPDPSTGGSLPE